MRASCPTTGSSNPARTCRGFGRVTTIEALHQLHIPVFYAGDAFTTFIAALPPGR